MTFDCDACGGELAYLGVLGRRVFGRCRRCGSIQGVPVCHECLGSGSVLVEAETPFSGGALADVDVACPECGGSGERRTTYARGAPQT